MNKIDVLTSKVEELIKYENNTNPEIQYLKPHHARLVSQIISNYNLSPSSDEKPNADMIFLGAPTGAGKDTLVRKIMSDNPDKNYVVLNMDMFRHYHDEISGNKNPIPDKDFAITTNQTSYELYYIIQEMILREFPGTNTIVTGTMRDLKWVQEIVDRYKNDTKTNYNVSLVTLAVSIKESAFSIFERYLNMVDTRDSSTVPLRYTDLTYHDDTVNKFVSNVQFFEDNLHYAPDSIFNSIKVYRRNKNILDFSEDTLVYDSNNENNDNPTKCAFATIHEIMTSEPDINSDRVSKLLDIMKRNSDYLKSQHLFNSILVDLMKIVPQLSKVYGDISK